MTTVVGLYDNEKAAQKAVMDLKDSGFEDDWIHVEAHGPRESAFTRRTDSDDLMEALTSVGVPRDEARFFTEGVERGGSLIILETPDERAERAAQIMNLHGPVTPEEPIGTWGERGRREGARAAEEARVTEAEEELHVGKRQVRGGGVRIHKHVRERPVEKDVHLRDEDVEVEHRPASKSRPGDPDEVFREETIEMTETHEEPVVEKRVKMKGEVVARKEEHEHTERIRDTVRETEVEIERLGGDVAAGFAEEEPRFREHYRETYGSADSPYSNYRPAYQYGYAYGSEKEYAGREYRDLEPELRRRYEDRYGKGTFEKVKDAIRHGYERARRRR